MYDIICVYISKLKNQCTSCQKLILPKIGTAGACEAEADVGVTYPFLVCLEHVKLM